MIILFYDPSPQVSFQAAQMKNLKYGEVLEPNHRDVYCPNTAVTAVHCTVPMVLAMSMLAVPMSVPVSSSRDGTCPIKQHCYCSAVLVRHLSKKFKENSSKSH